MAKGGIVQPRAFTPWITVAHSRLPGCATLALECLSEVVMAIPEAMMPIMNPISSKL
jgi:hypothetical protein